jgi:cystathionine gamma-synthase
MIVAEFGGEGEQAMLFSSEKTAVRCLAFLKTRAPTADAVHVLHLVPDGVVEVEVLPWVAVWAVMFPKELAGAAKKVWQHAGEGILSRRAEYCKGVFEMRGFREQ